MALQDYFETLGGQISALGLPSRRFASPAETGVASVLSGIGAGIKGKRALEEARRLKSQKDAFESKVGVPFDLFSKLSSQAQEEILKNSGMIDSPENAPLEQFGGRSSKQLMYQGAPSRTAKVPGGTGVFEGLPPATVQVGPPLPPLSAIGAGQRKSAIDEYLGREPSMDPYKQARIDYTKQMGGIRQNVADEQIALMRKRGQLIDTQRGATAALTNRRTAPDQPIDDWEVEVARRMGLTIPPGTKPTRQQFDRLLRYNRPAMAVLGRVDKLTLQAHMAEKKLGRKLTDQELDDTLQREAADLPVLAGPKAMAIASEALRSSLEQMRLEPDVFNEPATGPEEDQVPEDQLPPEYDENQDEPDIENDEDSDDFGGGYGR